MPAIKSSADAAIIIKRLCKEYSIILFIMISLFNVRAHEQAFYLTLLLILFGRLLS